MRAGWVPVVIARAGPKMGLRRHQKAPGVGMGLGVIFDLDGVVIDSERLQREAYNRVLARFGIEVSVEEYGREWIALGRGPEHAVRVHGLPVDADELRRLKGPIYHEILRAQVTLMPGVLDCLERLGSLCPLGLATNSSAADTRFVLDRFSIRFRFAAVVTRDMYQRAKPEPDAFLTAAAQLGLPAGACVVIEDAFKGVLAAHRAGCPCVAVPHALTRDNDFSCATRVVGNLDEVTPELIDALTAEVRADALNRKTSG